MKRKPAIQYYEPLPVVILSVDPGENSGWALFDSGKLVTWGEVDCFDMDAVRAIALRAIAQGHLSNLPVVMVIEKPFRGEPGASRPIWKRIWSDVGGKKLAQEWPSRWRSQLLGKGMGSVKQEIARQAEKRVALAVLARDDKRPMNDAFIKEWERLGHDACAAISIGEWATRAGKIGALLPKRIRDKCR